MNQRKEENDRRNHFMINLHESMGPDRDRLATPGSAVRHASVARHVTDCATRPGGGGGGGGGGGSGGGGVMLSLLMFFRMCGWLLMMTTTVGRRR